MTAQMQEHTMNLHPEPFEMIREGKKTIELRLYDEKRRQIRVGDTIVFSNTQQPGQTLCAQVTDLFVFDSFEELYRSLPLLKCGYTEENIASAAPEDMNVYYSREKQCVYGVVGIQIALRLIV